MAIPDKQSNAFRQRAGVNKAKHARSTIRDIDQPALHGRAAASQRNATAPDGLRRHRRLLSLILPPVAQNKHRTLSADPHAGRELGVKVNASRECASAATSTSVRREPSAGVRVLPALSFVTASSISVVSTSWRATNICILCTSAVAGASTIALRLEAFSNSTIDGCCTGVSISVALPLAENGPGIVRRLNRAAQKKARRLFPGR
jgi:hypothetical protein